MTKPAPIVFLLDVDYPVLDNDRIIVDLKVYLTRTRRTRPCMKYKPKTWGPKEVERISPPGGWHNTVVGGESEKKACL